METISTQKCHGGTVSIHRHESESTDGFMRFSLFLPPQAANGTVPVLIWLSGLTCTEENFTTKANAYQRAAELGIAIVAPDTSPRGDDVPDADGYDLGKGAGFYVDATQEPWARHYRMERYITRDLHTLLGRGVPALDLSRCGIFGHSMGGHGALTLFFRHRELYRSVSAFSPIVAPRAVPWGQKAFSAYLGEDVDTWAAHDACALAAKAKGTNVPAILIDQGDADQFLEEQLRPDLFEQACKTAGIEVNVRLQPGYDHSYYFIQSFIDDHLHHHAAALG